MEGAVVVHLPPEFAQVHIDLCPLIFWIKTECVEGAVGTAAGDGGSESYAKFHVGAIVHFQIDNPSWVGHRDAVGNLKIGTVLVGGGAYKTVAAAATGAVGVVLDPLHLVVSEVNLGVKRFEVFKKLLFDIVGTVVVGFEAVQAGGGVGSAEVGHLAGLEIDIVQHDMLKEGVFDAGCRNAILLYDGHNLNVLCFPVEQYGYMAWELECAQHALRTLSGKERYDLHGIDVGRVPTLNPFVFALAGRGDINGVDVDEGGSGDVSLKFFAAMHRQGGNKENGDGEVGGEGPIRLHFFHKFGLLYRFYYDK